MPHLLETDGVSFRYAGRPLMRFPSMTVGKGEIVGLVGPSGSGKSTLLMLMAGLLMPTDAATLAVNGQDLKLLHGRTRDSFRGRTIGIVLQAFRLLPRLSVLENLTVAQYLAAQPVDKAAARNVLAGLGIEELASERPSQLSRGQLQRAAIARAIVNRPILLLADEPTSSLDDEAAEGAIQLLTRESRRLGAGLLIATHDSRLHPHLDRIVELAPEPR